LIFNGLVDHLVQKPVCLGWQTILLAVGVALSADHLVYFLLDL